MILKALYDYYHRCGNELAPFGLEYKEIAFIIVIDKNGNFLRFEDRRTDKKSAQKFLVRKSVGRSSAPVANYLYDNSQYVLGYSNKNGMDGMHKYFDTFKTKIAEIYGLFQDNTAICAVNAFYQKEPSDIIETIKADPLWEDINKNLDKKYSTFSFLIEGDTEIVASKRDLIKPGNTDNELDGKLCLITGKHSKTVEVTSATMIPGSQATAKLVSFQVNSGYDSYGKTKGNNAPISEEAEFAYSTALNHMLRSGSHNKFMIGNRTFLFWASSTSEAAQASENSVFALFGRNDEANDDPNRRIEYVKHTFMSIYNGILTANCDDRFYILGLAPNAARIAVTYWCELPLRKFAGQISRHFDDMDIIDSRKEKKPYTGLHSILGCITFSGKSSDVTPNLPDPVVKSIFQGTPYPEALFQSCIRRIRAEVSKEYSPVNTIRAAIIKAYLIRRKENNHKQINYMLDKDNHNQGYLCGRLFAVLENLQYAANKQDSIRSSYMNAASSTPSAVFSTLLKLSNSHYSKLAKTNKGLAIFFDSQKAEIISAIKDFPKTLGLSDQGRFFLGYYHQKNYKDNTENEE